MTATADDARSDECAPVRLIRRGSVADIVLSRPERLNALDARAGVALVAATEDIRRDGRTRVVVVRGAGAGFCAGGDVKRMLAGVANGRAEQVLRDIAAAVHAGILALTRLPMPVIAAVHGPAHGAGFSLALACDLIVATESATFSQAFVRVGATPDSGSSYFLPRLVGRQLANELIMLGDVIDAHRAHRLGVVNRVVAERELDAAVAELAERLARGPAHALAWAKELIAGSFAASLEHQLEQERDRLGRLAGTDDFREGVSAFADKRRAGFARTRQITTQPGGRR
jgi:2-(1,2-epoxy-1,2-dihydrophenyl)acetyl-CoA isomerase